jgi:hypothetical protein
MKMIRAALGCLAIAAAASTTLPAQPQQLFNEPYGPSFGKLRDTLYLLDTTYLEVQLDRQMILQHFRSGRVDTYTCSTGDPRIKDGIATRPGIFTVQSKAKKTLSQEFQVYLNYWMGFDGGIGFHGLDSRSYYRHLGRRPSSHGCVRISNETGAKLFGNVRNGTPVYVHAGSPARVIAFADSTLTNLRPIDENDGDLLASRLAAVAAGRWEDPSLGQHLALPRGKRPAAKVGVGYVDPRLTVQYPLRLIAMPVIPSAPGPLLSAARFLKSRAEGAADHFDLGDSRSSGEN